MNIELVVQNYLQKIDNFFKEKSQKDIYIVYSIIIAIAGAFSYPFYDLSMNEFKITKDKIAGISAKINEDKIYITTNPEAKIDTLNRDIKTLQSKLLTLKDSNQYIKNKIETISSLIYDEKSWGAYLNSISINAKKHNIKIVNFTNKYSKNSESFGHILDIALQVKGNYLDTIKFINSLEKSELVVDVHDLSIKAQDTLNTNLNISVWGITYP